jgi:hypothetical protein
LPLWTITAPARRTDIGQAIARMATAPDDARWSVNPAELNSSVPSSACRVIAAGAATRGGHAVGVPYAPPPARLGISDRSSPDRQHHGTSRYLRDFW